MSHFDKVKGYLGELGLAPASEQGDDELVVVHDEQRGLSHLIVDCDDPILILEQFIFALGPEPDPRVLLRLLQMNRSLVHGAFVVDEEGERVLFRDTLQLESLDLNELEASISSLSLALAEYAGELLSFAKQPAGSE